MKHKKILLVANDNIEVLNVQRELTKHHVDHSLHIAKNGLDALALLMGCSSPQLENYSKTGKVQPDVILMDADSPNLNMIELLCIMQKYYSLQKIRVYLMATHPDKIDLTEARKYGIAGVIAKPFDMESTQFDAKKLMNEFGKFPQRAWFPFISLLPANFSFSKCLSYLSKIKYSSVQFSIAVATKAGIAGAVVAGGALLGSSFVEKQPKLPLHKAPTQTIFKSEMTPQVKEVYTVETVACENEIAGTQKSTPPKKQTSLSNAVSEQPVAEQKPERNFRIVITEDDEMPAEYE